MTKTAVEGSPDPFWSEKDEAAMKAAIEENERKLSTASGLGRRSLQMAVFDPSFDQTAPLPYGNYPAQRWNIPGLN